jgi:hypothetical protein
MHITILNRSLLTSAAILRPGEQKVPAITKSSESPLTHPEMNMYCLQIHLLPSPL